MIDIRIVRTRINFEGFRMIILDNKKKINGINNSKSLSKTEGISHNKIIITNNELLRFSLINRINFFILLENYTNIIP